MWRRQARTALPWCRNCVRPRIPKRRRKTFLPPSADLPPPPGTRHNFFRPAFDASERGFFRSAYACPPDAVPTCSAPFPRHAGRQESMPGIHQGRRTVRGIGFPIRLCRNGIGIKADRRIPRNGIMPAGLYFQHDERSFAASLQDAAALRRVRHPHATSPWDGKTSTAACIRDRPACRDCPRRAGKGGGNRPPPCIR